MSYNPLAKGTPPLARAAARASQNNSGLTILKGTPVRLTPTGMLTIDVSDESHVDSIAGIVKSDVAPSAIGEVVGSGTVYDITTSFAVGDAVYISKTGALTNIKPSIGVAGFTAGDFVVRIGVIARNTDNVLLKDLLISMQIMGQL